MRSKAATPKFRAPLWERVPVGLIIVIAGVVILGLMIGLPAWSQSRMANMSMSTAQTLEGAKAKAFSLKDLNGQTYTLTPGDGRAHVLVFYMGYFCGLCREQMGNLARSANDLSRAAEVVAISVDPPSELQKMDQVLNGAFRLLSDPDLSVIRQYQMEMLGGSPMADRGYVIIDGKGVVRAQSLDSDIGSHAQKILAQLKAL